MELIDASIWASTMTIFTNFIAPATISACIGALSFWLSYRSFMRTAEEKKERPISISDLLKVIDSSQLRPFHQATRLELERALRPIQIRQEVSKLPIPFEVKEQLVREHQLIDEIRTSPKLYYSINRLGNFVPLNFGRICLVLLAAVAVLTAISPFVFESDAASFSTEIEKWISCLMMLTIAVAFIGYFVDSVTKHAVKEYYFKDSLEQLTNKKIIFKHLWHKLVYNIGVLQVKRRKEDVSKSVSKRP